MALIKINKVPVVLLTFISLFFTSLNIAQSMETIYLWANQVPNEINKKHDAVKTENTSGNVTRLTNVTNPVLEVFKPDTTTNNGAGVIICPGGGYHILAIDLEGYEVAKWLNKLGFTAFVLQYRVPENRLGALNDIQRAIKVVRSKSKLYNINPDKIGVLGFSAGGSLAARASTNFNNETYSKFDEIDNESCKPDFAVLVYPAYLNNGNNNTITPELTITNQTPPMFIFATADDAYSNKGSLVLSKALMDSKIPVELHLLPSGGHGYGLRKGNIAAETWPVLVEKWLKKSI
ncbi:alpha/beta hydrolase [Sabulilitoribacter arenilitoris]|uniref:Alpha/beta hydrolase n=1 Tax=Wocania arenilitoris TaxID=2044858 RepID=A0AAE3EPG4_9FLAO|nr:alpha/beta hydrolase [Wocania arenilitoris]MCF7569233.1 alpha/beta hydrolase [Wocania arenilitoris]